MKAYLRAVLRSALAGVVGATLSVSAAQWQSFTGYRAAPLTVPKEGKTGFTLLTNASLGIHFTNVLSVPRAVSNHNLMNGSGLASGDYDGDGLPDLFFCTKEGRNILYRNLGNWRFEDVTEKAGIRMVNAMSTGATFADVNGDGWLDLLVAGFGTSNELFLNTGKGTFTNATAAAGLTSRHGSQGFALADVDGDGDLDLYVVNYGEMSILRTGGAMSVRTVNGKPVVAGRFGNRVKIIDGNMVEYGEPDFFYRNDGTGKFTNVPWKEAFSDETGNPAAAPWDLGLSAAFYDLNGDGAPDLYVCNDFQTPDRLWMNDGKGKFRAIARPALRSSSHFSMGVDFADVDRDGRTDFFVVDMLSRFHPLRMTQISPASPPIAHTLEAAPDRPQHRRNSLLLAREDGTFADVANFARIDASDWSWSPIFLDVDLDGYEDLLIGNGHAYDTQDLDTSAELARMRRNPDDGQKSLTMYPQLDTPNVAFHNKGDLTFEETGAAWGFNSRLVSHGITLADFDGDGDLDVVVNTYNAAPLIYRNDSPAPRVAVRLKGKAPNVEGIGAQIRVLDGPVPQSQQVICGSRYLAGADPLRVFAAGPGNGPLRIEVTWRSGRQSVVTDARPNWIYEIDEAGSAAGAPVSTPPAAPPLFQDVSAALAHVHTDNVSEELKRQPLLPNQLGYGGPGVTWFDLNGDGRDDLIVGTGAGGTPAVFLNRGQGKFEKLSDELLAKPAEADTTTLLGLIAPDGARQIIVASTHYETGLTNRPSLTQWTWREGKLSSAPLPVTGPSSVSALAAADVDGDGVLDLFVGGYARAGRYPESEPSVLLHRAASGWSRDEENSRALAEAGLVRGATFADLNGDGRPDLIVGTEWGPVRVYLNDNGRLREATRELGLESLAGWWIGVAATDIDGDGRLDLVAGNWGLNSSYQASTENPARLYFADLDGSGTMDLIEAESTLTPGRIVPRRDLNALSAAVPMLREHFPTHRAFSTAVLSEVLGKAAATTPQKTATTLQSMVFLNRGGHFEAHPLPREAQFAPAFGVVTGDFDGDGWTDVFLSQNFFRAQPGTPRIDGGRGLLLRNRNGTLEPVTGTAAGVIVYGEQRGAACADFDSDGRLDLVVTQNSEATRLFRNEGTPAMRGLRLHGPAGNPEQIGAKARWHGPAGPGSTVAVAAGSGYWSQSSSTLLLGRVSDAGEMEIQWPGGKVTRTQVPAGTVRITIDASGALQ